MDGVARKAWREAVVDDKGKVERSPGFIDRAPEPCGGRSMTLSSGDPRHIWLLSAIGALFRSITGSKRTDRSST